MLVKYFDKIYTFLVVYRENGFAKASKKLNISQPAVTQQIKILEDFLGIELFNRNKNIISLTKDGEKFLEYAIELENFVSKFEKKLNNILYNKQPFIIGASPTLGNYNLPECVKYFTTLIGKDINLIIQSNKELIESLKSNNINLAFFTQYIEDKEINIIKWTDDELVLFSNKPLPKNLKLEELKNYKFICREENSSTREFIRKLFRKKNFDCKELEIISIIHSSTALKNIVMKSNNQVVSIISKAVIKEELEEKKLFISSIEEFKLKRPTYIGYKESNKYIKSIIDFLTN